jgi:hypothetical protein
MPGAFLFRDFHHEGTKTQRVTKNGFVILGVFVSWW